MTLLLLAFACSTPDPNPADDTGTASPTDTGADDTADTHDTDDTADTDTGSTGADADADGFATPEDCDDTTARIHPDAAETCDGVDEDCDGAIDEGHASLALLVEGPGDGTVTTANWFGFDADDHQVLQGLDPEQDGLLNSYLRTEWANGWMSAEERSNDGVSAASRFEYDRTAEGAITEVRVDENGDGAWDWSYGYVYTDGRFTGFWYDFDQDGIYDQSSEYVYNASGLLTEYREDADGDGVPDRQAIYVYDDDHLITVETDSDGDGVFEALQTNTWEGERLVDELVIGGTQPYRRSYQFLDADDVWDSSDYDIGDDGSIDYRFTQTVGADGAITSQTTDQYADGVEVYAGTYEVDADGNIRNTSYLDGVVTSVWEYDYTEGLLSALRSDSNGDGLWESVQTYDGFGHLLSQTLDAPISDGLVDTLQTWSYDDRGRRTGSTTDALADGVLEFEQWSIEGYACGSK